MSGVPHWDPRTPEDKVVAPGQMLIPIPEGCGALWHADTPTTDPKEIVVKAEAAARRTHTPQAVLHADGTVQVIPVGVTGTTPTPGVPF